VNVYNVIILVYFYRYCTSSLCNSKDTERPVKYRYIILKYCKNDSLIDYFRLYECSLSSEVYIEGNNHDHTDLKDDIVEIKEAHGINEYFKILLIK
jgi:hypothetical protein